MIPLKDENPTRHRPVITLLLIVACASIYLFWQPTPFGDTDEDAAFSYERAAIPCEIREGRPLRQAELVAQQTSIGGDSCGVGSTESAPLFPEKSVAESVLLSMFLHGSLLHLGGNLLFLWIFGNNVEDHLGPFRYLAFYVVGGVVATLAHVAAAGRHVRVHRGQHPHLLPLAARRPLARHPRQRALPLPAE